MVSVEARGGATLGARTPFCALLCQHKSRKGHSSAFNIDDKQHLRVVFLPREDTLADAMGRLGNFLEHYRQ